MKKLLISAVTIVAAMTLVIVFISQGGMGLPTATADTQRHTKVEDTNTTFYGLFAGTDGGGADLAAEKDPCTLAQALINAPTSGWVAGNITLLGEAGNEACAGVHGYNGEANLATMTTKIATIKGQANPGDEFLLYVSAHGSCPVTGPEFKDDAGNSVTDTDLKTLLNGFHKRVSITLIIDACKSGGFITTGGLASVPQHKGFFTVITAVDQNLNARADVEVGSAFVHTLKACLADAGDLRTVADNPPFASPENNVTTSKELYDCAKVKAKDFQSCLNGPPVTHSPADQAGNDNGITTQAELDACIAANPPDLDLNPLEFTNLLAPPKPVDEGPSNATHSITLTNVPPLTNAGPVKLTCGPLTGPTRIERGPVGDKITSGLPPTPPPAPTPKPTPAPGADGFDDIKTEIVSMELKGTCNPGGIQVTMRESPTRKSRGYIQEQKNNNPGALECTVANPGLCDSFFDVFIVIEATNVPIIGTLTVHNQEPVQMFCKISAIPPIDCDYGAKNLPIAVYDDSVPKKQVGELTDFATHTLKVGGLAVDLDGDLGELALETAQSSGGSAGLLAGTVAGIGALAVTLTGAAWYARRRWAR